MTAAAPSRVAHEDDRVRLRPALLVVALSVAVVAVGVAWPWLYLDARGAATAPHLGGVEREAPRELGGLRTTSLAIAPDVARDDGRTRHGTPARDRRFAWADRERGLVRMPIDDAIDLWVARHGGAGGEP